MEKQENAIYIPLVWTYKVVNKDGDWLFKGNKEDCEKFKRNAVNAGIFKGAKNWVITSND